MYFFKVKFLAMLFLMLSSIFYKRDIFIGQKQKLVSEEKEQYNNSCKINSTSPTSISVSKPVPPATTPILGIVIVVTSIVLYCWCCCCYRWKDAIDRTPRRRRVRIQETYLIGVIVFALLVTANAKCECDGATKIMCSGVTVVPSGLPCEMTASSLVMGPGSNPMCADLAKIPNLKEVDVSNCQRMVECVCSYVATCTDGEGCHDRTDSGSATVVGYTISSICVIAILSGLGYPVRPGRVVHQTTRFLLYQSAKTRSGIRRSGIRAGSQCGNANTAATHNTTSGRGRTSTGGDHSHGRVRRAFRFIRIVWFTLGMVFHVQFTKAGLLNVFMTI